MANYWSENTSGSATGTGAVTVGGDNVSTHTATLSVAGTRLVPENASISGLVTVDGPGTSGKAATIAGVVGSTLSLTGGLVMQSGSIASFTLGTPNGTNGPALIATSGPSNSLVVNGTAGSDTISFSNPEVGTYELFSYTGSTTFSNFQIGGTLPPGFSYQLQNGSGQIDLQVTALPVIWSGLHASNGVAAWDTATQNWSHRHGWGDQLHESRWRRLVWRHL